MTVSPIGRQLLPMKYVHHCVLAIAARTSHIAQGLQRVIVTATPTTEGDVTRAAGGVSGWGVLWARAAG